MATLIVYSIPGCVSDLTGTSQTGIERRLHQLHMLLQVECIDLHCLNKESNDLTRLKSLNFVFRLF